MEVNIDVPKLDALLALLGEAGVKKLGETILDTVGPVLLNRIRTRYLAETDPDGVPWVKSYAAIARAASGQGGGTLFNTGTLFHSIQYAKNAENNRTFGTDVTYAEKHQFGDPATHTLRRMFLGFSTADLGLVNLVAQNKVKEIADRLRV